MGFHIIEKFFKIFMFSTVPTGPKLLKIRIFHENGLFSVINFRMRPPDLDTLPLRVDVINGWPLKRFKNIVGLGASGVNLV